MVAIALAAYDYSLRNNSCICAEFATRPIYLHHILMRLPPPFSWLWSGWMAFSHLLGKVMSFIILTVFWLIGIGIYGIIAKLIKVAKPKKNLQTYWIPSQPQTAEDMQRQF